MARITKGSNLPTKKPSMKKGGCLKCGGKIKK
jgi:hypothetical protein